MKQKVVLPILLVILLFLGFKCKAILDREVIELGEFTEYYEATDAENGGLVVLDSNYITIEKEYKLKDSTFGQVEDKYKIPTFEVYKVKKGDALSTIASRHNQDLSVLKANNPGLTNSIKIGQEIKLATSNGIFYKVKSGDSIYKIASKYRVKSDDIINYNKLKSKTLKIGQELYLHNPDFKVVKKQYEGFRMPVSYTGVTSPFGKRLHPVLKRYIYHKGVDLRARYVKMYSSKDGKVTYAGWMNGYGKLIIIKHSSGYETRYAHLNNIYVKVGQRVTRGQLIGKTGMTGRVTGPHLHYEIRKNGTPLNPMRYLQR